MRRPKWKNHSSRNVIFYEFSFSFAKSVAGVTSPRSDNADANVQTPKVLIPFVLPRDTKTPT